MSTRYYALEDYGLVINLSVAKEIFEYGKSGEAKDIRNLVYPEELDKMDVKDFFYDVLQESLLGNYYGDVSGEVFILLEDGSERSSNMINSDGDDIIILPIKKYPRLYKKAYNSYDEVLQELKETYGWLFPANYNLANILGHFIGMELGR